MRKSLTLTGAAFVAAFVLSAPASAQLAVVDLKAIVQAKQQVDQMRQQLSQLQRTYSQLESTYKSATGSRGMGDIFNDRTIRNNLPSNWQQVYDSAQRGGYAGISGSIDAIARQNQLSGTVNNGMGSIRQRQAALGATNKAVGMQAYAGAQARLNQLDQLTQQISRTQDPKAIAELQARIASEQGAMQNEQTKLQLMSMLQQSEADLVRQQKRDLSSRILNPNNTKVPVIR
ncbi:P-type DNA transfer protein VirB5 [Sphingomonas sp. RRHST34]|uniref:P-type DNA transfer protein VirB5 n=1 Tax=Sphingomonas citri TaxID=2862499 RepID=A0ABS7BUF4_9SPHN|nr:P-type DNA transfer protein VirB5 [Sphingomonas citri]MBW6533198.1 P-type DNA transfer protein VirB5 [Sphingomonas citri]